MEKKEFELLIIGESKPLYYDDLKVAIDCQSRYMKSGKIAMVMQYDPETDDYHFVC